MNDNNANTSSDNSGSGTELPDFNNLKPFDMEPRKKVSDKNYAEYKCQLKNLLSEQRDGHNSWCKCGRFCKPMETEKGSFVLQAQFQNCRRNK